MRPDLFSNPQRRQPAGFLAMAPGNASSKKQTVEMNQLAIGKTGVFWRGNRLVSMLVAK